MILRVNKNPSNKELRQFGWTLITGFFLLGMAFWWRKSPRGATALWTIGMPLGLIALLIPPASRLLYKAWMGWAVFMGGIVTRVILTLLFFLVISPIALLFRCFGRDILRLKKVANAQTYWTPHAKIENTSDYDRLF